LLSDHAGSALGVVAALLLVTGTGVYHWLEDWSWVDAFCFSAFVVTTVGFGDLSPTTDGSKMFTVLYIGTGIAAITAYLNERFNCMMLMTDRPPAINPIGFVPSRVNVTSPAQVGEPAWSSVPSQCCASRRDLESRQDRREIVFVGSGVAGQSTAA
jgi:hypothetical protein